MFPGAFNPEPCVDALLLVIAANLAPWLASKLFGGRGAAPLDGGTALHDGTRLLGSHKTWRGLVAGLLASALTAWAVGYSVALGLEFGALALAADALSSFIKRRLHRAPGANVPGLDQLPEALIPLLVLGRPLGIGVTGGIAVSLVFMGLNLILLRTRRRVGASLRP